MIKVYLKGCGMSCLSLLFLGFIAALVKLSSLLQLEGAARLIIPAIFAGIVTIFIIGNVYVRIMKRYKVLAPAEPYEYTKMAQLELVKDETTFVRRSLKV